MEICQTIEQIRQAVKNAKAAGKTVGLVPTMGALHAGHKSLIERCARECDFTVVSIFVNPTQFEPGSDFESYPRTMEADSQICQAAGADIIFSPSPNEIYPREVITWVNVEKITDSLCGSFRPGHFKGVTTVCAKLFNIVLPDKAYFGQKDAQQLAVIKRMVADLNMPLQIVACSTIREPDGLAMSSRNKYLTPEQRSQAPLIYASLELCQILVDAGETDTATLKAEMEKLMTAASDIQPQYIEFVDFDTLESLKTINGKVLVAVAAHLGQARLIDNIILND